jgi:formylglycine-generating enzyme
MNLSILILGACSPNAIEFDHSFQGNMGPEFEDSTEENHLGSNERIGASASKLEGTVLLQGGIELVEFPPGEVLVGLEYGDPDWDSGHQVHLVELTNGFSISETEVTQEQFAYYMGYDPVSLDNGNVSCADCPVHTVSWYEVAAYSNAMSDVHGLQTCFDCEGDGSDVVCSPSVNAYECRGFRPPTEAEWEMAAMGGEDFIFPGSDDLNEIGWWEQNSDMKPHPVGEKMANGYGLYDMGGNIREYVYDWYALYPSEMVINPVVEPQDGAWPAERGGSWACRLPELRVDRRNLVSGYDRDIHTGFRIARTTD